MTDADLPLLAAPADGVPEVVSTPAQLTAATDRIAAGHGPLAVDTERAHGYRYWPRAYLIQLRRAGAGTVLLDPVPFWADDTPPDLGDLGRAAGDTPWIIHASTQDMPCLAEVGLVPPQLFDTELAGRLLGWTRVGLGAMVERVFGQQLAKTHSAADWSSRPLPDSWLTYAALDVELLIELRERLTDELRAAGKDTWAEQEFAYLAAHAADPPAERVDPWRRTSGIQNVRTPVGLAVVRAVWEARDELARTNDKCPSKLLKDVAISGLGAAVEKRGRVERSMLRDIDGFERRVARRYESRWLRAATEALQLPRSQRPPVRPKRDGPPNPKSWAKRAPDADARRQRLRAVMDQLAEQHDTAPELICSPGTWRELAWAPCAANPEAVDAWLAGREVRPWQRELTVVPFSTALAG